MGKNPIFWSPELSVESQAAFGTKAGLLAADVALLVAVEHSELASLWLCVEEGLKRALVQQGAVWRGQDGFMHLGAVVFHVCPDNGGREVHLAVSWEAQHREPRGETWPGMQI